MVTAAYIWECTKDQRAAHFKWVNWRPCEFHLNKPALKILTSMPIPEHLLSGPSGAEWMHPCCLPLSDRRAGTLCSLPSSRQLLWGGCLRPARWPSPWLPMPCWLLGGSPDRCGDSGHKAVVAEQSQCVDVVGVPLPGLQYPPDCMCYNSACFSLLPLFKSRKVNLIT